MISIVIPTLNEEKYLPYLLDSIKKQSFKDYEIIVSDYNSIDKTKEIARKYGCIIVKGGLPGKGRNNGAKIAKHDLLFLDADTTLPDNFLEKFVTNSQNFDLTSCKVIAKPNNYLIKLFYAAKNFLNKNFFIRRTSGQCIFIKKELFNRINGYDESLYLAEEHDLVQRAKGKYKFFSDLFVYNSPRRFKKYGFWRTVFISSYSEIYRILFGKIRKKFFEYEFGHY